MFNEDELSSKLQKQKENLKIAIIYLDDAINFRTEKLEFDTFSLVIYRIYYSTFFRALLYLCSFALMILPFIEQPTSLSWSSDILQTIHIYELPYGFSKGIEIICFFVFSIDLACRVIIATLKRLCDKPMFLVYAFVLILSASECILSFLATQKDIEFQFRRYLRPFFLISTSFEVRKLFNTFSKVTARLISIFLLLFMLVFLFAILGMHLFGDYNPNFKSIDETFIQLMVLFTASNTPDIMIPSYSRNRLTALYFIAYLAFGVYCLLNITTAVLYDAFQASFKEAMRLSNRKRQLGVYKSYGKLVEVYPRGPEVSVINDMITKLSCSTRKKEIILRMLQKKTKESKRVNFGVFNSIMSIDDNAFSEVSNQNIDLSRDTNGLFNKLLENGAVLSIKSSLATTILVFTIVSSQQMQGL